MKKDNSTIRRKVAIRKNALKEIDSPCIMETHGGYGGIYEQIYTRFSGVVFEKNDGKAEYLGYQRPAWRVYECDCISALSEGVAADMPINFLDVDPYGEPWNVINAFFSTDRNWQKKMAVTVNDGLRQKLKMNGGWTVKSLASIVQRYGNSQIYENYLEICQELLKEKAAQAGYALRRWAGYYCGHAQQMTHYAGIFER